MGPESMPLPPDVVWGPLVFEARRFVELRKKSFSDQFWSSESFGMGIFYTLNVFLMQFYLGAQPPCLLRSCYCFRDFKNGTGASIPCRYHAVTARGQRRQQPLRH